MATRLTSNGDCAGNCTDKQKHVLPGRMTVSGSMQSAPRSWFRKKTAAGFFGDRDAKARVLRPA